VWASSSPKGSMKLFFKIFFFFVITFINLFFFHFASTFYGVDLIGEQERKTSLYV